LNLLASTACEKNDLKRVALFSVLTGLRNSDIQKMRWKEISLEDGTVKLHFTQKKTKGVEYAYFPAGFSALRRTEASPVACF